MLPVLFRGQFWLLALFVTFCLTNVSPLFAQKTTDPAPPIKFGTITPDQFTQSSVDSTAEAVVLYDYGEVIFSKAAEKLWLEFTHHVRTRIKKKSAYDRATIQLPLRRGINGHNEYVRNFEGFTYNLANGSVLTDKLAKTGHFTEKLSDNYWVEKYTLSNVREGSIIDYRYTIQTPFTISYNPRTWRFQRDVPVNWSEYRITIPDYFIYNMIMGGYVPLLINEHKATNVNLLAGQNAAGAIAYRFAMKNVPAFRDEAYITTDDDYLSKIDFELAGYQLPNAMKKQISVSWEDLDKTLLAQNEFGGQINRAGFLHDAAKSLLSQHTDTLSRITAAYDYIRQNIKWNEETSLWSLPGIKKVFENKKGDAADINLMLVALLREMDIEANPVILSTRSHGRINESFPLIKKFNYVVAQVAVGGKDMLLDATDAFLLPGMLPSRCLNGIGRLVHPTNSRFVSLAPTQRDNESFIGAFTIGEDGEISGTLDHSHGGYSAWNARKSFASEGKTKYMAQIQKERPSWQIEQADFSGADLKSSAFNEKYTVTLSEACGRAGDRLYFKPMLTEAHGTNPFKEAERLYPVDFGVEKEETFFATYTLPKGYQVEEMPKTVSMTLPDNGGKFVYQVVNTDGKLQIISRILLYRPMYYAEEYATLRELFSRIVAKQAEQVVLKRGAIAEKK